MRLPAQDSTTVRKGFTLIELLVSTMIIGLLSVTAATSLTYVRMKARDARRVSDVSVIRNAIEFYFEVHSSYPPSGPDGLVLGSEDAEMITDAGITSRPHAKGSVYLQGVPYNVLPGGVPYFYRSLNKDGSLCNQDCASYEVTFALETPTGELAAGPHLLTDAGYQGGETGETGVSKYQDLMSYVPSSRELASAFGTAAETAALAQTYAQRGDIQAANASILAPISTVSSVASLLAAAAGVLPIANAGQLLLFLIAEPFQFLSRRKRQGWGTVYNSATRVPIGLATVRLIDTATNRPAATKVTDKDGRFAFTPKAGTYRLEAVKPGFVFPSVSLQDVSEDGPFTDLYHGTLIRAAADGETLTFNLPMDPFGEVTDEPRVLLSGRNKKSLARGLAMVGPFLSAVSLAVSPKLPMLLLFLFQLFLYQLFKRLAEPPKPKSQGTLYDIDTRAPIAQGIVRVLSLPYQKVLETQLTDARGRYSFQVGAGRYALTATKPGYQKTETEPIDFTAIDKPAWIASDLPMRKAAVKPL